MAINRLQMLNELSQRLPAANEKIRAQRQAAIGTGVQGAIQSAVAAPAGQPAPSASQIATAGRQAAGQEALQATQENQQIAGALGQQALQERSAEFQNQMARVKLDKQKRLFDRAQYINTLGGDLKAKLFDKNLQFAQDEQGRKFTNLTQLMDWSAQSARNLDEFKDRMQVIEQASAKKQAAMRAVHAKVLQAAKQGWAEGQQRLDQEQRRRLQQIASELEEKMRKEQRRAKNSMMAAKGLGMVGAVGLGFATGGVSFLPYAAGAAMAGGGLAQAGEAGGLYDTGSLFNM